jgi:hypothetical protein
VSPGREIRRHIKAAQAYLDLAEESASVVAEHTSAEAFNRARMLELTIRHKVKADLAWLLGLVRLLVWLRDDASRPVSRETPTPRYHAQQRRVTLCQADDDDDCDWSGCPQLREDGSRRGDRHCPYDVEPEYDGQPVEERLARINDVSRETAPSAALECTVCGNRPGAWGLMKGSERAGDQCPCCYLDDYDCDGVLVEASPSPGKT